jgi:hypothetical protein
MWPLFPVFALLVKSSAAAKHLSHFAPARSRSTVSGRAPSKQARKGGPRLGLIAFAGEIALKSPKRDVAKAENYFEHALTVAREQQAKSWELRATMSMAHP